MASETVEALGKWIAVIGSVIAAGQAGTAWISGQWQATAAREKAAQELKLEDLKERSALASEYLKLIISKDTALAERVTLLDALAALDGHPLQQWARERHTEYEAALQRSQAAFKAQQDALETQAGAQQDEKRLEAEIAQLTADSQLEPDDAAARDQFRQKILAKAGELAKVRARITLVTARVDEVHESLALLQGAAVGAGLTLSPAPPPPAPTPPAPPPPNAVIPVFPPASPVPTRAASLLAPATVPVATAASLAQITGRITADLLKHYFPASAAANIDLAAPYLQAALQEFGVTNPRLIACIIATIAVETPNFGLYTEPEQGAERYDGRFGNTQPGDGVRFRGRGWIGLTGRANYLRMSQRLGLGTSLVDSPEAVGSPEIASRIIVAWFIDQKATLLPALERDDLGVARRIVNGSPTNQIQRFTTIYRTILADLAS